MSSQEQKLLAYHLPFEDHVTDDVVLLKGGGVFAMFAVSGVYPWTADQSLIVSWLEQLHNAYQNVSADDVKLTIYNCRGEADPTVYLPGAHSTKFPAELDAAYRQELERNSLYSNQIFLGVHIEPPRAASRVLQSFTGEAGTSRSGIAQRCRRLSEVCNIMQAQLPSFGLRRLGYVTRDEIIYDEIAEAVVFAVTGVWRAIAATTGPMSNSIFSEDIHFRYRHIEIDGAGDPYYAAMFTFRYPASTLPGMLQRLSIAPYRCTVFHSYDFLGNAQAEAAIRRKQTKRLVGRDPAVSQTSELSTAMDRLLSGDWQLGQHGSVIIVFAESKRALTDVANATWRSLNACGLNGVRLKTTIKAGWLSMLPGGLRLSPRYGLVKSTNFVAFAPLYSVPAGADEGHWPGGPIATFRTLAGTPYNFHWHVRDVGNTLVTGTVGSGKTTLIGFLIAMTASRARIIGLDYKCGWKFLAERLGANHAVLGNRQPRLNPLKGFPSTPSTTEYLTELARGCIGGQMTEEENRRLDLGLEFVMQLPPPERSWSEVRAFFDDSPEGAGARLDKWCWPDGELGWVIDAPRHTLPLDNHSFYDTTALLENPRARGPALSVIYHQISLTLDGRPVLIPADEGWRVLIDPDFSDMIGKQIRTIRSKGGAVVFVTQSPTDILESGIAHILKEHCHSQIHLSNPRASKADYIGGFGLTEGQYDAFSCMPSTPGTFLIKQEERSVVAQLPLGNLPEYLAVLSAREIQLVTSDNDEMLEAAE